MKIIFFLLSILSTSSFAHPVIYGGGWVYQGTFMPKMNMLRLGHSVTSRYALVANGTHFKNNNNYQDYTFGVNVLAKRWLQHDSQGNLYFGTHGGRYEDDSGKGNVGNLMMMADWESRKHYVVAKSKSYFYDDKERLSYTFRYGFAPYVAGMNTLQSWLILQTFYFKEQSRELIITPLMRFFYKNVLWEIGYSTRGQSYLTLMVHY